MAIELAARKMLPGLLTHSGAKRARETAEILAAEWPRKVELREQPELYDASPEAIFDCARALPDSSARVAFVGHNPGLGELAVALAGAGPHPELKRMAVKFPTGAVAALDFPVSHWREIERNSATLALFLTPAGLGADLD